MFGTEEPLVRGAQLKAAIRQRVRQPVDTGGGIARTIGLPDSLASQAAMDDMQSSIVSQPAGRTPIRLASMNRDDEGGAPASAIMTAQFRQSGGSSVPVQQVQCRNGRCGVPQGMPSGLTNSYNLGPGEVVTAIDGVPTGAGMAPQMGAAMPATPMMSSAPPMGAPPDSTGVPMDPASMVGEGRSMQMQGAAAFDYSPATYSALTAQGRALTQTGLGMMARQPELELEARGMTLAEQMAKVEAEISAGNRRAQYENTAEGSTKTLSDMLTGSGEYNGLDPKVRAEMAAAFALQRYNSENAQQKFDYKAYKDWADGQVAAYQVGSVIANRGTVGGGNWALQEGGRTLPAIQQLVTNRYYGKKDTDGSTVLAGDNLRNLMHQELDGPVAYAIAARLYKADPNADRAAIEEEAMSEAFQVVDRLHGPMDSANSRYARQQGGWYGSLGRLGKALDGIYENTEPLAVQPGLPDHP